MIKLKGGKAVLNKTVNLTEKQKIKIKDMSAAQVQEYILSCMGLVRRRLYGINSKHKSPYKIDKLGAKRRGSVLRLFESATNNAGRVNHTPIEGSNGQWVGIEIECLVRHEECLPSYCEFCGGNGSYYSDDHGEDVECIECDGSGHGEPSESIYKLIRDDLIKEKVYRASVRGDSSINSGDFEEHQGIEITLLLNTANGFGPLERVCALLREKYDAQVNTTCGLHVHFDQRGLERKAVRAKAKKLGHALPLLSKIVPKSRLNNTYCALRVGDFRGTRYTAINLSAFEKHGTLEVRLHGGSINSGKIKSWISLLMLIMDSNLKSSVSTIQDLIDKVPVSDSIIEYVDRRWTKFNPEPDPDREGPNSENNLNSSENNNSEAGAVSEQAV